MTIDTIVSIVIFGCAVLLTIQSKNLENINSLLIFTISAVMTALSVMYSIYFMYSVSYMEKSINEIGLWIGSPEADIKFDRTERFYSDNPAHTGIESNY